MDATNKNALFIMRDIINRYLDGQLSREEAVETVFFSVDLDLIHCTNPEIMVTDCYYTIKHLTEIGYETTDFELVYFRDCIDGKMVYNLDEKNKLLREHFDAMNDLSS